MNDVKLNRLAVSLGAIACYGLLAANAWAQATCDIRPQTKTLVTTILCGQTAPEKEYQQFGQGCFERSVTKRLEDTAVHVMSYEKCLDPDFSAELMQASLKAMNFMQNLSACVSETVNLEKIMTERMEFVARKAGPLDCTPGLRTLLKQKRPNFEVLIRQANEFDQDLLLEKPGVVIDEDGNISDR